LLPHLKIVPPKQAFYEWFGISRSAHSQAKQTVEYELERNEWVLKFVREKRNHHPNMGGKKLYDLLQKCPEWAKTEYKISRDRLFDLLRVNHLLVDVKRRAYRTTFSGKYRFCDLYNGQEILDVQSVLVGDITYIDLSEGCAYLSLLTDAYSRKIVGYCLYHSLGTEGCLRAFRMAMRNWVGETKGLIHHTDHGSQYTSKKYRKEIKKRKGKQSMGEVGNCYDNALAERMNGILKIEYNLDAVFATFAIAKQAVKEAIWLYNNERPHLALGYQTPNEVHEQGIKQLRKLRN